MSSNLAIQQTDHEADADVAADRAKADKSLYREAVQKFSASSWGPSSVYVAGMTAMLAIPVAMAIGGITAFLFVPVAFCLFGLCQYYAIVGTHEAIHYGFFPHRGLNDLAGNVMGAMTTFHYGEIKKAHLDHHRLLGEVTDPDYGFYIKDNKDQRISLLGLFLRPIAGLLGMRKGPEAAQKAAGSDTDCEPRYQARKNPHLIIGFQLAVMAALAVASPWLSLAWFVALGSVPGFLMHVRLILEHSSLIVDGEELEDRRLGARTHAHPGTLAGGLVFNAFRLVVSPFSFNFHHEHHVMPTIPYYNLFRVHGHLRDNGYYDDKAEQLSHSYVETFRRNLKLI